MLENKQEEEKIDEDLIMKKDLLQREIVDRNYNKEQFIDYCLALKQYGDDLSQWSYDELKTAVNSFVSYHLQEDLREKEEQQQKNQFQNQRSQIENQINQINNNISIRNYKDDNIAKTYSLICLTLNKSPLNDNKINVMIQNPKGVETSIFKSNYIIYEVLTFPTQWKVSRRYSDFDWLRQTLKKIHPGQYCPPLPGKKLGSRRFENDFVLKRMNYLNKFMNDILENEIFKASEVFISFLSIENRDQFEYKKKSFDSMKTPERVEEYYSLDGKINLLKDDFNEVNYTNIQNYVKLQSQLLDRLNYNLKNYKINIDSACTNLEDAQKDFEMLTQLNNIVKMKEEITKTYEELTIFFKNWKRIIHNQNDLINNKIRYFFKYVSMENKSFEELVQERIVKKEEYEKEINKLNIKKEEAWTEKDINKWNITNYDNIDRFLLIKDKDYAFTKMFTSETQNVTNLHNKLNFANYTNNEQLKLIIKRDRERFINNIKLFTQEFYVTLNDSLNIWSELASFVK